MDTPAPLPPADSAALEGLAIDLEVAQCGDILLEHGVQPTPDLVQALWQWAEGLRTAAALEGLTLMPTADICAHWRPGSYEWGWEEEFADMAQDPRTAGVLARVQAEGIGYADTEEPVLLGSDGRVWDGHHRIYLAATLGIPALWVRLAPAE